MKTLALPLLCAAWLAVGATACGGNQPAPATPSGANASSSNSEAPGATNAQGSDDPNRALTSDECSQLADYVTGICHETHTRQSRIEGWCSDMVERASAPSWSQDCTKSVKYMDYVCFRSTDNAVAMMACDRSASE